VPRSLTADGTGSGAMGPTERARLSEALSNGTLPLFDFGGLFVQVENADGALLYQIYSRQFPLDDRRVVVLEDKAPADKAEAFGELGRLWVLSSGGWKEWPQSGLGPDEHELLARVADAIRLQVLHTIDYRKALANPGSAEERKRGRDLSRALARDVPVARDLATTLLETAERLSVGHEATPTPGSPPGPTAGANEAPPSPNAIPPKGAPVPSP
jgi:hypothetical protein